MPNKYLVITWDILHHDARALAAKLMARGQWRGIVAVTRGGLIPAAIIARELGTRVVESVSIATYEDEALREPQILKLPGAAGDGDGFLVVDDLVDTGTTAALLRQMLPRAHFACLYAKPAGQRLLDTWIKDVPQETWILFPWDTAPQYVAPLRSPAAG